MKRRRGIENQKQLVLDRRTKIMKNTKFSVEKFFGDILRKCFLTETEQTTKLNILHSK